MIMADKNPTVDQQAEQLYQLYPRHVGRLKALAAIVKAIRKVGFDRLMERTTAYAAARHKCDPKFTPNPATWFNQGRWDDDPAEWRRFGAPEPIREKNQSAMEQYLSQYDADDIPY